jgi:hypothetical protein
VREKLVELDMSSGYPLFILVWVLIAIALIAPLWNPILSTAGAVAETDGSSPSTIQFVDGFVPLLPPDLGT